MIKIAVIVSTSPIMKEMIHYFLLAEKIKNIYNKQQRKQGLNKS